ncbi:ATP-binding protein [Streptomyces sp. T21Q-yed]|nr:MULTISPECIES: ATP-binding protein [unclassified Streptomyces]MDF3148775.1 ATP-binding protein [Streptomyces sp. T21Q-yed]WDF43648.1 ATP-binding protein [Streptomyces sp. T12]
MEHLILALALEVDRASEARRFGRSGQAQQGVDVVGFFDGASSTVYQAKRYEKFTPSVLRQAVADYAGGPRPFDARRLVVVTTASVRDTALDLELVKQRGRHPDLLIELWGQEQLSDMLFSLPDVVRRFFGEATMRDFCRPVSSEPVRPDASVLGAGDLDAYLAEFSSYLSQDLHELIPLALKRDGGTEPLLSADLAGWLREGRHAQLVGPSGTGKSHTMLHTARELAGSGCLPLLVQAAIYEGRWEESLDECVAPFTRHNAAELVWAARAHAYPVVLLVDALNECPGHLQDRLLKQLSGWCRRASATLLLSSHRDAPLPRELIGDQFRVTDPDGDRRTALLRSYGATGRTEDYAPFGTAFELALAARLVQQILPETGRVGLLSAVVSEHLRELQHPTAVRQVLHHWSLLMDERLTGWLPLAEAMRSAALLATQMGVSASVVDDALHCSVIRIRQQRLEFRHEWYARLITAESLVWRCSSARELATELTRPHRRGLSVWAVPLMSDRDSLRDLLRDLSDSDLLTKALRGQLGPAADQIILTDACHCLEIATDAISASAVVAVDPIDPPFRYKVTPAQSWSDYELGLFSAIGATARDGRLLDQIVLLLRKTEEGFRQGAAHSMERHRPVLDSLIATALAGPSNFNDARLPADVLVHAAEASFMFAHEAAALPDGAKLARCVGGLSRGEVAVPMLLCFLLRHTGDAATVTLTPRLLAHAWSTGAAHLQWAALDMITSNRSVADTNTTAEIIELLTGVNTNDLLVSSALVDALHIYGQIDSPYQVREIMSDIARILASPDHADAHDHAQRIINSQFEDVVAAPFAEAIESLSPEDRIKLTALAVQQGDAGLFTDVLLHQLLDSREAIALPAFRYWASHLDVRDPFRQNVVACHVLGIQGCAAHLSAPPPLLSGFAGADAEAWRCYGEIIFWLHRPGLSADEQRTRSEPSWRRLTSILSDAAVDPLYHLCQISYLTASTEKSLVGSLLSSYPEHVRAVLHHALTYPNRLSSLFPFSPPHERSIAALSLLKAVGDETSIELLHPYRSHPDLAAEAAETIRHLNSR